MNSNSLMFMLLIIFVILTLVAIFMCFKRSTPDLKQVTNEEEEDLVNYVKNMNRTYNRFYWGNNELD